MGDLSRKRLSCTISLLQPCSIGRVAKCPGRSVSAFAGDGTIFSTTATVDVRAWSETWETSLKASLLNSSIPSFISFHIFPLLLFFFAGGAAAAAAAAAAAVAAKSS